MNGKVPPGELPPSMPRSTLIFVAIERTFESLNHAVFWGALVAIGYFAFGALRAFAGTDTDVSILLHVLAERVARVEVSWPLAILFLVWAVTERRLRLRKTEALQGHIKALEQRLDPQRTSSGLLPTGESTPEDRRR